MSTKYCPKCFKKFEGAEKRCPIDGTTLVVAVDQDLVGAVLDDRYTVLERVGEGGMGIVYKAEHRLIKRIVALKVLRREIVQDESAVKRFLNEARSIASLTNPHTVTLYDFGVTRDGLLYYTMELLEGKPLKKIIKEESPMAPRAAADLINQVCESLEEAHEQGILHRDLKPDNLFIVERKGRREVKVLDFGIAKFLDDTSGGVTRTGTIIGTPEYFSPEQALDNPVVPASDLYSLGVVLYEMLSGSPPFVYDSRTKVMLAHINEPVPPVREKNPNVVLSPAMETFLQKALAKSPSDRFGSVVEFKEALSAAVADTNTSKVEYPLSKPPEQGREKIDKDKPLAEAETALALGEEAMQDKFPDEFSSFLRKAKRVKLFLAGFGAAFVVLVLAIVLIWKPAPPEVTSKGNEAAEHKQAVQARQARGTGQAMEAEQTGEAKETTTSEVGVAAPAIKSDVRATAGRTSAEPVHAEGGVKVEPPKVDSPPTEAGTKLVKTSRENAGGTASLPENLSTASPGGALKPGEGKFKDESELRSETVLTTKTSSGAASSSDRKAKGGRPGAKSEGKKAAKKKEIARKRRESKGKTQVTENSSSASGGDSSAVGKGPSTGSGGLSATEEETGEQKQNEGERKKDETEEKPPHVKLEEGKDEDFKGMKLEKDRDFGK